MPTVDVKVDCSEILGALKSDALGQFVASRALEYMEPYVPFRTGDLAKSAVATPFKVGYGKSYARRVWEGTGMVIRTQLHPLATSHWESTAAAAHGGELAEDVSEYLSRM